MIPAQLAISRAATGRLTRPGYPTTQWYNLYFTRQYRRLSGQFLHYLP